MGIDGRPRDDEQPPGAERARVGMRRVCCEASMLPLPTEHAAISRERHHFLSAHALIGTLSTT